MSKCYRVVRLLPEEQDRRPEPDRQVEEAGLREPLLPQMHPGTLFNRIIFGFKYSLETFTLQGDLAGLGPGLG